MVSTKGFVGELQGTIEGVGEQLAAEVVEEFGAGDDRG